MNGLIYMRISPSGKRYIGQTTKTEELRWKEHIRDSRKESHKNTPLNAEIRKYGGDSFDVVILEDGIQTEDELNEREIYWIKKYHTLINEEQNGLNILVGGLGHRTYQSSVFVDLYNQGYSIGEISLLTGAHLLTISSYINSNKTENYKRGRQKSLRDNPPRAISCYDVETCELVHSFQSVSEAKAFFNLSSSYVGIYAAATGRNYTDHGYMWKYDDEPMSFLHEIQNRYYDSKNFSTRCQPVINVETGERFRSVNKAGNTYGIDGRMISDCCRGKKETAGGYHWRFENQDQIFNKSDDKRSKPVLCIETNTIYSSMKEASADTGIYINKLRDCLKGRIDTVNGFHWKYLLNTGGLNGK